MLILEESVRFKREILEHLSDILQITKLICKIAVNVRKSVNL